MSRRITYLLDLFPTRSETFIYNEILELLARGWDVKIIALHRMAGVAIDPAFHCLIERTHYINPARTPLAAALSSFAHIAARSPLTLYRELRFARGLPGLHPWFARRASVLAAPIAKWRSTRIHVHFINHAAEWAMHVTRLLDVPLTITAHGYDIFDQPLPTLRLITNCAEQLVTPTAYNKRYLVEQFGVDAAKIAVISNGIDADYFSPDPKEERVPGRLLTVARLWPGKGVMVAVEAARILRERGVEFDWVLVGDGPERERIAERIAELRLGQCVHMLGAITGKDIQEHLRKAQVFVLPSLDESQGVAYLEAMATQTPVIGTKVRGVPDTVLDGKTGFLVEPGSAEQLADRIAMLLRDDALQRRLGEAGRKWVLENFTLTTKVDRLVALWNGTHVG